MFIILPLSHLNPVHAQFLQNPPHGIFLGLPSGIIPSDCVNKILFAFLIPHHLNNNLLAVQIVMLLSWQFSLSSCDSLPPRSRYSP
jgi:hypothetical protein